MLKKIILLGTSAIIAMSGESKAVDQVFEVQDNATPFDPILQKES